MPHTPSNTKITQLRLNTKYILLFCQQLTSLFVLLYNSQIIKTATNLQKIYVIYDLKCTKYLKLGDFNQLTSGGAVKCTLNSVIINI
jgi:hypothetical protein